MGCSLGLRLSIPLHTCYIVLSFDTLVASPNQSHTRRKAFLTVYMASTMSLDLSSQNGGTSLGLLTPFTQSVPKSVPLFHDATIKSTPKGFPQDISNPGCPGLYRPLEKFDGCVVLFLQTAAQGVGTDSTWQEHQVPSGYVKIAIEHGHL